MSTAPWSPSFSYAPFEHGFLTPFLRLVSMLISSFQFLLSFERRFGLVTLDDLAKKRPKPPDGLRFGHELRKRILKKKGACPFSEKR